MKSLPAEVLLLVLILATALGGKQGAAASALPLPPRNMVLTYIDARSDFNNFTEKMFLDLIVHNSTTSTKVATASSSGGGRFDPFFDGILIIGYDWKEGKCFWPNQCPQPLVHSDWDAIFNLWVKNLFHLEAAAKKKKELLEGQGQPQLFEKTKVYVTVIYPDVRADNFCSSCGPHGSSLNFTKNEDRRTATSMWVERVVTFFETGRTNSSELLESEFNRVQEDLQTLSPPFENIELAGFYWFLETLANWTVAPNLPVLEDREVIESTAEYIHHINLTTTRTSIRSSEHSSSSSFSTPLVLFTWIPYYNAAVQYVSGWRSYGFDFATIQPNYAFNDCNRTRFQLVNDLIVEYDVTGVEMELPLAVRNTHINKNATLSFDHYIEAAIKYNWTTTAKNFTKTYYYGNDFAQLAVSSVPEEQTMYHTIFELASGDL